MLLSNSKTFTNYLKFVKKLRGDKDESVRKRAIALIQQWSETKLDLETINDNEVVLFYARGKNKWLSNLRTCHFPVVGSGGIQKIFPSSEHMYVSKRFADKHVDLFTTEGPFASFEAMESDVNEKTS